jgi:hypothetical protein
VQADVAGTARVIDGDTIVIAGEHVRLVRHEGANCGVQLTGSPAPAQCAPAGRPQPWRIAHWRIERCRPATCQTQSPAGLPSASSAAPTRRRDETALPSGVRPASPYHADCRWECLRRGPFRLNAKHRFLLHLVA